MLYSIILYICTLSVNICLFYLLYNLDYGLFTLRKNYGVSEDPVKLAREEACKVYLAPEIVSTVNPSPNGPADVFSYAVILFEIATRIDLYFVCDIVC